MVSEDKVIAYSDKIRINVPSQLTHQAAIEVYVTTMGFFEEQQRFIESLAASGMGPRADATTYVLHEQNALARALHLQEKLTSKRSPEERLAQLLRDTTYR